MKHNHVSFGDLCDFFENEITDSQQKACIQEHLEECPECSEEYKRLKCTMGLLSDCQCQDSNLTGKNFCCNTISTIKGRRRRRFILRSLPAIAASILVIMSIGFKDFGFGTQQANLLGILPGKHIHASDLEEVFAAIRTNDATILSITDSYVEGEVRPDNADKLHADLGNRKVLFSAMVREAALEQYLYNTDVEPVGISPEDPWQGDRTSAVEQTPVVRFRVYR